MPKDSTVHNRNKQHKQKNGMNYQLLGVICFVFEAKANKVFLRGWHQTPWQLIFCVYVSCHVVLSCFVFVFVVHDALCFVDFCFFDVESKQNCINTPMNFKHVWLNRCEMKKKQWKKTTGKRTFTMFCAWTTSTALYVATPLFVLSVQKLSSLIFTIFATPTKKNHKHNQIEVHEINIEVQRNEPQKLLQGARDCPCCVFPLGPASLRPI